MKENEKLKNDIQMLIKRYIVVPESIVYEYFSDKDKEQIARILYRLISEGSISKSKYSIQGKSKSVGYAITGINRNSLSSINGNTLESLTKSLKVISNLRRYYPNIIHTPTYFPATIRATVFTSTGEEKHIEILYCTPDNVGRVFFHHIENESLDYIRYVILSGNFGKDKVKTILSRISNIRSIVKVGRTAKAVEYYSPDEYIAELCVGGDVVV